MKWETDQKMRPEESRQAAAARNSQHTATTKDGGQGQNEHLPDAVVSKQNSCADG